MPAAIRAAWEPDITVSPAERGLYYIHKRKDGRDIYFFANMATADRDLAVTFHWTKGPARAADPRTGEITPLQARRAGRGSTLQLNMKRLSAQFVVFG